MTSDEAIEVVGYLTKLFPHWKPTPELLEVIGDAFTIEGLSRDDAMDICRDHAKRQEISVPEVGRITKAIRAKVNQRLLDNAAAERAAIVGEPEHNRKTIGEWAAFYRAEGRGEWAVLPANVRRGLRRLFGYDKKEATR